MQDALQNKETIINEAKSEAENILADFKQKAEAEKNQIIEEYKKLAEEKKRKIYTTAELSQRQAFLQVKQQLIDDVFEKAIEKLENLPVKKYQNLLHNMLIASVVTGEEEIIVSAKDLPKITPEFIDKVNAELKKQGKAGKLKLSAKTDDMIGGFILISKDMEINCTFDSLIKLERENSEIEIAKILFEE